MKQLPSMSHVSSRTVSNLHEFRFDNKAPSTLMSPEDFQPKGCPHNRQEELVGSYDFALGGYTSDYFRACAIHPRIGESSMNYQPVTGPSRRLTSTGLEALHELNGRLVGSLDLGLHTRGEDASNSCPSAVMKNRDLGPLGEDTGAAETPSPPGP